MRAKSKWAIGLLVFQLLSVFSWLSGVDYDAATLLLLSLLYQQIPTIGALILIFYNHKYATIYKDKFNLLQKWIFVLVWIQPIYSFLSYALAGSLSTVIARWIGSCLFPAISCLLLYFDWKDAPTQAQQEPQQMQIPLPEEKKETPTKQQPQQYQQQNKEKPAPCEEQARIMKTVTIVFITCFIVLPLVILILILFLLFI